MATQAQRIADLEDRVAFLAAEVERYHREACVIRALEDIVGGPMTTASHRAQQQSRHLYAVPDVGPEHGIGAGA